jgi:hypothetical protein
MDTYIRGNGKWAKISKVKRGTYAVAFGWDGKLKADRIQTGPRGWAQIAAEHWIKD